MRNMPLDLKRNGEVALNPKYFEGSGFHGASSGKWISFHRDSQPPEFMEVGDYWISPDGRVFSFHGQLPATKGEV